MDNKAMSPVIATVLMVVVTVVLAGILVVVISYGNDPCSGQAKDHIKGPVVDKSNDTYGHFDITIHDSCSKKNHKVGVSQAQFTAIAIGNTVEYNTKSGEVIGISR